MADPSTSAAPARWEERSRIVYIKSSRSSEPGPQSWDLGRKSAVERAAKTLRELRVAEVVEQDIEIRNGELEQYRVKLKVSFKYEDDDKQ